MNAKLLKTPEPWILICLFVLALFLRTRQLDLMSFRFDQAAAAFRARETVHGNLPFTGIINSMGFRNAPGFIWLILPPFLITGNPVIATAWFAVLISTAIFPIFFIAKRITDSPAKWIAPITFAAAPYLVFFGRDLWAQCALVPLGAWAFWALLNAIEKTATSPKSARNFTALSLGLIAFATSVHFSAILYIFLAIIPLKQRIGPWKNFKIPAIISAIIFATMLPAVFDYISMKTGAPRKQPDYAAQFTSILPEPLPIWVRLPDTFRSVVFPTNQDILLGNENKLTTLEHLLILSSDRIIIIFNSLGLASLVLISAQHIKQKMRNELSTQLSAWLFLPILIGCLLVSFANSTYFATIWFIAPLLILFMFSIFEKSRHKTVLNITASVIALSTVLIFTTATLSIQQHIAREKYVAGPYYIPFKYQLQTVQTLKNEGISRPRYNHLSGEWFQHSYDYIATELIKLPPQSAQDKKIAFMDDLNMLTFQPHRKEYLMNSNPIFINSLAMVINPSEDHARVFATKYYSLDKPLHTNITEQDNK